MKKNMHIAAIVLMAGNSSRFGKNKLLHTLDEKMMYEYAIKTITSLSERLSEIVVVTKYDEIENALKNRKMRIVRNEHSERGISSSIKIGLEAILPKKENAYLFLVGDQPFLKPDTIIGLLDGFEASNKGLGCVSCKGELGNPALFSEKYRAELEELTGDKGGKKIIRNHKDDLYEYIVDNPKELEDIDRC